MLYDNALLLIAYTECYQITKDPFYKGVSEKIITFINREMTSSDGAFYSAIDADSEGVEGKYYTWDYEEIIECLGDDLGELYTMIYDITPEGNFEGKNIPNLIDTDLERIGMENDYPLETLEEQLEEARVKLLTYREKRVYPHVDDKILTSWNGMMIAALAKAGKVYGSRDYIQSAEKSISFIEKQLYHDNRLMARYRDGETKYKAYVDDYAFLLWGYIELYEATFALSYLEKASKLAKQMIEIFWDKANGGFYFSGKDSEKLLTQDKEIYDGAIPSGNSVAAVMLTRLGYLTGETNYLDHAEEMYYTFYEDINRYAAGSPFFLQSLQLSENPTVEVVVLGDRNDPELQGFLEKIQKSFSPNMTLLVADHSQDFARLAPFAAEYKKLGDETTIYVCEDFACRQPTTDIDQVLKELL